MCLKYFGLKQENNFNKSLVVESIKSLMPSYNVPISINETTLGLRLITHLDDNGEIVRVDYNKRGVSINFLDLILAKAKFLKPNHEDKFTSFDNTYNLFLEKLNA